MLGPASFTGDGTVGASVIRRRVKTGTYPPLGPFFLERTIRAVPPTDGPLYVPVDAPIEVCSRVVG